MTVKLRIGISILLALAWSAILALVVITGQLMSLDEEWQGWGDLILNP
ncbi:MAG TPA: hypothetical protein VM142_06440 [Acidimicrobiales bacterium]|nr:hypothetical protein [Acidimicrobiales bacterium]